MLANYVLSSLVYLANSLVVSTPFGASLVAGAFFLSLIHLLARVIGPPIRSSRGDA